MRPERSQQPAELLEDFFEPPGWSQRVEHLMGIARDVSVDPVRKRTYALLLTCAERKVERREYTEGHTRKEAYYSKGRLFGFEDGYTNHEEVERLLERGRASVKRLLAAARRAETGAADLHQVLNQEGGNLPLTWSDVDVGRLLSVLVEFEDVLGPFLEALEDRHERFSWEVDPDARLRSMPARGMWARDAQSVPEKTLLWWSEFVRQPPKALSQWEEMHRLARVWQLSEVDDIANFRRHVLRIRQRSRDRNRGVEIPTVWRGGDRSGPG